MRIISTVLTALIFSASAAKAENKWYVGTGLGISSSKAEIDRRSSVNGAPDSRSSDTQTDNEVASSITFGRKFTAHWSAEFEFGQISTDPDASYIALAPTYKTPLLGDRTYGFISVGGAYYLNDGAAIDDGFVPTAKLGLGYRLTDYLSVVADARWLRPPSAETENSFFIPTSENTEDFFEFQSETEFSTLAYQIGLRFNF